MTGNYLLTRCEWFLQRKEIRRNVLNSSNCTSVFNPIRPGGVRGVAAALFSSRRHKNSENEKNFPLLEIC